MSDEQKMPDVIYARPAGNGCGWWYPQDDNDTPYLRCDIDRSGRCDIVDLEQLNDAIEKCLSLINGDC